MSNLTDALIAAKLVGGSGGSGGGSGLPEIKPVQSVLLPEQTLSFSSQMGAMGAQVNGVALTVGETYTVVFDGDSFSVTATTLGAAIFAGNTKIMGMAPDTGEPFLLLYNAPNLNIAAKTGASHTVGITSMSINYPDGSVLIAKNGEWAGQTGYGYEAEGGEVVTFDRKFIPLENVSFNIATTSSTTISANATNDIFEDLSVPELDAFPPNTLFPVVYCALTYNTTEVYGVIPVRGRYMNGQLSISCYNFTSSNVTVNAGTLVSLALLIPHKIELD